MLVRELLPLLTGVERIVDLTPEGSDLARHLMVPEGLRHERVDPAGAAAGTLLPGDLLLAVVGPDRTEPDELGPAMAALPNGGRVLLLSTWPAAELPYHRLLDPLGGASLQVTDAIPLSQVSRHQLHVALLATRVTEPLPPRAYLMDLGRPSDRAGDVGLRTLLRIANEHVLGELVARPARSRLREQDLELAELRHQLTVAAVEQDKLRRELAALRASASFRIGRTVVEGVKHPGRAVVSVPRDLTNIWRTRRSSGPSTTVAEPPRP